MAIDTIEFGRANFCLHEKFILHFADRGLPIQAMPAILDDLVDDGLVERTDDVEIFRLTTRGAEAYRTYRIDIARAVAA